MNNPNKLETQRSKLPNGQRPKGPGWVLKKSGEQSGKPHSEWERKTNICVRKNMSNPNKLELVFDCLIDTVERATETAKVYNDNDGTSVSWAEVYEVREQLREQNMSNPEIRAIKVLLDELEQEFNPEELSSPNATVKLLDVQITLYDLRKLMIMQERK